MMNCQYENNLDFLNDPEFWNKVCSDCNAIKSLAWHDLYAKSWDTFFSIAFRSTRDRQFAENAVQELMLRAYKARFRMIRHPNRKFLFVRILTNVLRSMAKKLAKKLNEENLAELLMVFNKDTHLNGPEYAAVKQEVRMQFLDCFKRLSPEKKEALKMYLLDRVGTYEECADTLNVSTQGFRSRVTDGKKRIKSCMERKGFSIPSY